MGVESLGSFLDNRAQLDGKIGQWSTNPDRKSNFSYNYINDASDRLGSFLQQHDVLPGDRIVLWGPNSPQWVISYFAALKAGAVVVPFDVGRENEFLKKVTDATQPRFLIAGEAQRNTLSATNDIPVLDMEHVDALLEGDSPHGKPDVSRSDTAEIVFTSGTSGNPKGVMLTHGNILSNIESIQTVVPLKPEYKLLSILPLSHMFETTAGLLTPIASGASILYAEKVEPRGIMLAMNQEGITCMAVVPQVLQLFKKGIEMQAAKEGKEKQLELMSKLSSKLPNLLRRLMFKGIHDKMGGKFEFFVCGGAKMDPDVANFWENLGIKVLQGYGMTEASPIVTSDSMSKRDHRYVGHPIPGVEVQIAEDKEVLIKGPNIMKGYFNNQDATDAVLQNGWYHTGDLGRLDNGKLKLLGRKGNMIVLPNGMNVHPEDIEQVLAQTGVKEAVVFQRVVNGKDELHAVLLMDESSEDPQALMRSANKNLAPHQKISGWTIWEGEDFPRTHTRKTKRADVISTIEY